MALEDKAAHQRWKRLDIAMGHFQDYLMCKQDRFDLSIIDLIFVSNFKGGNASITEPKRFLTEKLAKYSQVLRTMHRTISGRKLTELSDVEFEDVKKMALNCFALTEKGSKYQISGFGPSYASALISAYFPDVVPVIDRRILNGAEIGGVKLNLQGQVKNIASYFSPLFDRCRAVLLDSSVSLRELDRQWFVRPLPKANSV
jgi:hypothetical protein